MKIHPPLQFMFMLPESRATSHIFIRPPPPGLQIGGFFGVGGVFGVVGGVGGVSVVCGGVGVVSGVVVVCGNVVVSGAVGVVGGIGVVKISHLGFQVIIQSLPQSLTDLMYCLCVVSFYKAYNCSP